MRICLSDGASAKMLVDAMMEMGAQKPAVFYANTANDLSACNIISDYLGAKSGIADVIKETFNPETDRDYSSQVEKFRAAGVDCIILCCEYTPAALLMSQCHEKDYRPQTCLLYTSQEMDSSAVPDQPGVNGNGMAPNVSFPGGMYPVPGLWSHLVLYPALRGRHGDSVHGSAEKIKLQFLPMHGLRILGRILRSFWKCGPLVWCR